MTTASATLPSYDPALRAYHIAFEPELDELVKRYAPAAPGARVLDCPCGDGFYTHLFARHMGPGALVAADLSPVYLENARLATLDPPARLDLRFETADAYDLPFDEASFDLVWCAQSMITLDDPLKALQEMARVLKPGGRVAVLETDEYHHVLLPWPVNLELAIQRAVREVCKQKYGSGAKFSQARKLRAQFLEAGLQASGKVTVAADRVAPFGAPVREFLLRHFEHLRKFIEPELKIGELEELERFTSADDPDSFLNRPDAELTCLATLLHATK